MKVPNIVSKIPIAMNFTYLENIYDLTVFQLMKEERKIVILFPVESRIDLPCVWSNGFRDTSSKESFNEFEVKDEGIDENDQN